MKLFAFPLDKIKKHEEWYEIIKKNFFGKIKDNRIYLNIFELLYLYENRKNKKITIKKLEQLKNKYLEEYLIFKDLVNKGFVVKTALKYGFNFRVYRKKDFIENEHSLYLVYVLKENKEINSFDLIAKLRVAHSVRKRVLFAFVDSETSIIYYENRWLRL
ncbi:MAG: tRNA-intron lyase [Nanoarchaeota archaeon]